MTATTDTIEDFLNGAAAATAAASPATHQPEPNRDRWGRYLLAGPALTKPEAHTRATTMARTTADTFNLDQWGRRMMLQGASKRPDLVALAASLDPEQDKKRLNELADACQEAAAAGAGANYGTAVHSFTAKLDAGEKVTAPPPLDRDLAAYASTLAARGIRTVPGMIERVVSLAVCDERVAGTFDRLNTVDGWPLPVIGDVKTAKQIWSFGEIAVQLALYAHAELLHDIGAGTYTPMPEIDRTRGLVFHLPVGRAECTVYVVDLAAGWEAVQLALDVRAWRKRKDLAVPIEEVAAAAATDDLLGQLERSLTTPAVTAPSPGPVTATAGPGSEAGPPPADAPGPADPEIVSWLHARVEAIRDGLAGRALPAQWPAGVPTFKAGGPTTAAHCDAIEAWCDVVEKVLGLPFGPTKPGPPPPRPVDLVGPDPLAPPRTPPEVHAALRARFEAIRADDLRVAATVEARELGVANVEHLESVALAVLVSVIERMESSWEQRKAHVASLLAGYADDEAQALVDMIAPPEADPNGGSTTHWGFDQLEADHVERLEHLVGLVDAGVLRFAYTDDFGTVVVTNPETATERLVEVFGGRQAALTAARDAARASGAPGPRAVADVAGNPGLLAAALRRGGEEA